MRDVIETCHQIWEEPYREAKLWKEMTKGKVIGCFPMYVPGELVQAAGALYLKRG